MARIARLGAHCLVSWPDDSSSEEEDDGQVEEEEDGQVEEDEWQEEEDPADMEKQGEASPEPSSGGKGLEQGRQSERLNHGDDNNCRNGGLSWTRKNLSLLMTRGWTLTPQLVAAFLCV